MSSTMTLDGSINFFKNHKKRPSKSLSFDISVPTPPMDETLISNFGDLKLSESEKRDLTLTHRKKIQCFKFICQEAVGKESKKLIKALNEYKDQPLVIRAREAGAYICLAAIFSGKLPSNNQWRFELCSVPLALFPSALVKNKNAAFDHEVSIVLEENCWLRPFKSLYQGPEFMKFKQNSDDSLYPKAA